MLQGIDFRISPERICFRAAVELDFEKPAEFSQSNALRARNVCFVFRKPVGIFRYIWLLKRSWQIKAKSSSIKERHD